MQQMVGTAITLCAERVAWAYHVLSAGGEACTTCYSGRRGARACLRGMNSRLATASYCLALLALPAGEPVAAQMPPELRNNVHVRWGYPGGSCRLLIKRYFLVCSDTANRVPQWVTYLLGSGDLHGQAKRGDFFHPDTLLPAGARAEKVDYRNSGYDRGHMAPAADFKRTPAAMYETFVFTNMAPQRASLNQRIWERLENQVRKLAREHGSIWVFIGPLYLNAAETGAVAPDSFIGPHRVAVPTHFFKVVICEHANGGIETFAFIMPNQEEPFTHTAEFYLAPIDKVERLSGLDFLDTLSGARQQTLESARAARWPVP